MLKKTIAIVVAAFMIIACLPVFSMAAGSSPSPAPGDTYTLTVKSDNANAGKVTKTSKGQDTYEIVATVNSGYKFVEWKIESGEATFVSGDKNSATATVKLSANSVVKAVFNTSGSSGSGSTEAPTTGYDITLLVLACASALAGAAFVAKKARA